MNAALEPVVFRIAPGQPMRLPPVGGELTVMRGRAWLTHDNALDDEVLEPGDHARLGWAADAVIEPLDATQGVTLRWVPLAAPNAAQARVRRLGAAVAARVRGAWALARRTPGSIAWVD